MIEKLDHMTAPSRMSIYGIIEETKKGRKPKMRKPKRGKILMKQKREIRYQMIIKKTYVVLLVQFK